MITNALNRLYWRFGGNDNKNPFPVNQSDLDALQEISNYIDESEKKQYEHNELFAKLYIYLSQKIMENDGSTVFETNHRRKIGNLLKKPLSHIIEDLKNSLNDSEMYFMLDKSKIKGGVIPEGMGHVHIDYIHEALSEEMSPENVLKTLNKWVKQKDKEQENIMELYKENPDAVLGNVWDYETVQDAMIAEVNNVINLNR